MVLGHPLNEFQCHTDLPAIGLARSDSPEFRYGWISNRANGAVCQLNADYRHAERSGVYTSSNNGVSMIFRHTYSLKPLKNDVTVQYRYDAC